MTLTLHSLASWRIRAAVACLAVAGLASSVAGQPPPVAPQPAAPPMAPPPGPPTPVPAPLRSYTVAGVDAGIVAGQLQELFAGQANVVADRRVQQVIVAGGPDVQLAIGNWLASRQLLAGEPAPLAADLAAAPSAAAAAMAAAAPPAAQALTTQSWQLRNLSWKDFENRLLKTWGSRLTASVDSVGDMATFRFPPTAAGTTSIVVDHRTSLVTIASPHSTAASWQRLMKVLDARPVSASEQTSIVPIAKSDPSTIRKAVSLLRPASDAAQSHRKQHIGQFVAMLFQPEGGNAAQEGAAQPDAAQPPLGPGDRVEVTEAPPGTTADAIARLVGNVQIEILDDVVIVRGRAEDVERVMQIIEQIEQQSLQFRPEVEIYHLRHVDATALSEIIAQVSAVVFARQAPVTIVPLTKPNALVLIGRKESIPTVVELIQKLDQPVGPDSEFQVFMLKHMSAIDAERVVRQFFTATPGTGTAQRTGLGTRVGVIAEYRANALIVQASPRDLVEVRRLIESLDVETSPTTNMVRVFKLRNSVAQTLAPILQEAITGQAATQQQQQQGGGGAGATSPARATPPAVNLQFLQIGPGGQRLIQSGILANLRVTADTGGNSLIVVGPASAMDLMDALIRELDGLPATEAVVKVFTLSNGDATSLATMLQTLFGQQQQQGVAAGPFGLQLITAGGDSTLVPLRFSVDTRTNSIIASGNAGDLEVVRSILVRLDEGDVRQRSTEVYRLRNAPAADVATAVQTLMTQQQQLATAAPDLVTPAEQIERQIIVVPEIVTNSLIVSATPRYLPEIQRIINELDKRPPMVVIQVVIAEVTLTDNEQFGIEWGLQDSLMFDRGIPPAAGTALQPGYNFNGTTLTLPNQNSASSLAARESLAGQALSNLALGRLDSTLGFGGLVLTASNESVSVLLRALEQSSRAQVIARPQVQTLDNQPAFVQVGSLVPRITGTTTTNFGVQPSVQDTNVGIILQVTPRTSEDGMIVMQIAAEKSAVGPQATGIPISVDANGNPIISPQILITTAQTTVAARSGQTVILGGLITKDQLENSQRIPYLADIPVLGRLFRFDTYRNQRTELLIIMTPYLLKSDEEIQALNLRETERLSWCLADIVNIHGPVDLAGNPAFNGSGTPLIFPDVTPGASPIPESLPGQIPAGPAVGAPQGVPWPTPAVPQPGTMGAAPTPGPAAAWPPQEVIVPQPPSLAAPPAEGATLVPQTIQPAAPPAGTQALRPPLAPLPAGPPPGAPLPYPNSAQPPGPVLPAAYQQPPGAPPTFVR